MCIALQYSSAPFKTMLANLLPFLMLASLLPSLFLKALPPFPLTNSVINSRARSNSRVVKVMTSKMCRVVGNIMVILTILLFLAGSVSLFISFLYMRSDVGNTLESPISMEIMVSGRSRQINHTEGQMTPLLNISATVNILYPPPKHFGVHVSVTIIELYYLHLKCAYAHIEKLYLPKKSAQIVSAFMEGKVSPLYVFGGDDSLIMPLNLTLIVQIRSYVKGFGLEERCAIRQKHSNFALNHNLLGMPLNLKDFRPTTILRQFPCPDDESLKQIPWQFTDQV